MIIHGYYVDVDAARLKLSNDRGDSFIVPYVKFLDMIKRLVLSSKDRCLVICGLAEERFYTKNDDELKLISSQVPGYGDLLHLMYTIENWPELADMLWEAFFAEESRTVDSDCKTINNKPFMQASGYLKSKTTISWRLGWRRNELYA